MAQRDHIRGQNQAMDLNAMAEATVAPGTVAVIGLPHDGGSSFLRGPAKAPPRIRRTLHNGSSSLFTENGINLEGHPLFVDLGDLTLPQAPSHACITIERAVRRLTARQARVLALGGDHAVTFPVVKALSEQYEDLTVLHLDAHPDLYDSYDGNRLSHACPFARIMETGRIRRLIQVGIRGMNDEQRRQAARFGVACIEMKDWQPTVPLPLQGPLYISVDLDVLDPAFAPGVSHHEPGGLSTREVLRLLQTIDHRIVGADIVEYNPERDINDMTAAVAAKLLKEIAGRMLQQQWPG